MAKEKAKSRRIGLLKTPTGIEGLDEVIGGERNRGLYILKSRCMSHSNQIREFLLTDHGIDLLDVYVGPSGVLTGSARLAQETREKKTELAHQQEVALRTINLDCRQKALQAQIVALHTELEAGCSEMKKINEQEKERQKSIAEERKALVKMRKADKKPGKGVMK